MGEDSGGKIGSRSKQSRWIACFSPGFPVSLCHGIAALGGWKGSQTWKLASSFHGWGNQGRDSPEVTQLVSGEASLRVLSSFWFADSWERPLWPESRFHPTWKE